MPRDPYEVLGVARTASDDDIKNCFAPPVTDPAFKSTIVTVK